MQIRAYLEGIIEDTGIENTDKKEEMIEELYKKLDEHIARTVIEHIPDESMDMFIRLNEEKRPKEEVEKFLLTTIPNAKEVFEKAFRDFRNFYTGSA